PPVHSWFEAPGARADFGHGLQSQTVEHVTCLSTTPAHPRRVRAGFLASSARFRRCTNSTKHPKTNAHAISSLTDRLSQKSSGPFGIVSSGRLGRACTNKSANRHRAFARESTADLARHADKLVRHHSAGPDRGPRV